MRKRNDRKGGDPFNPASFSLSDFKRWMENQQKGDSPKEDPVGLRVESKVGVRKLVAKMETDEDVNELAEDFKQNGGVITEVDGHNLMVEVESGTFIIHRMYVKRKD